MKIAQYFHSKLIPYAPPEEAESIVDFCKSQDRPCSVLPFSELRAPKGPKNHHSRPYSHIHSHVQSKAKPCASCPQIPNLNPSFGEAKGPNCEACSPCCLSPSTGYPPLFFELDVELCGHQDSDEHARKTTPSEADLHGPTCTHCGEG